MPCTVHTSFQALNEARVRSDRSPFDTESHQWLAGIDAFLGALHPAPLLSLRSLVSDSTNRVGVD